MKVLTALSVSLASLASTAGPALADSTVTATDLATLSSDGWCEADLAQDIEAKLALFDDEAILIMPGRAPLDGIEAIRTWQTQNYAMVNHDCTGQVEISEARIEGAIGLVRGRFAGHVTMKDGSGSFDQAGYFLNVFEQDDSGDWKISRMVFTY
ncbi:YybH family protein [Maricaulis sp. D1M11]|uniref:YybH family protein n=1 Tax=Maricaulis sp. D1M11 TaxID=3076117 RepID=UPI0039B64424